MVIPHVAWWAVLNGPTVPTKARHLLFDHLEYVRKTGGPPKAPPEEDAPGEEGFPAGDGEPEGESEPEVLEPAQVLGLLVEAAVTLHQDWRAEVLESAPSRFLLGLCLVADRGAYLLDGIAPDLAGAFARLRDQLMPHSEGSQLMSDADLGRAVDELEALVPAVAARVQDLSAGMGSPPGGGPKG